MKSPGRNLLITLFVTLGAFFSVAYTACKKTEVTPSEDLCAKVNCQNGGNCFKGKCTCPGGYDGDFCEVKVLNKFTGNWLVTEKITGSSKSQNVGSEKKYNVTIAQYKTSGVDFVINNFMGVEGYNGVQCRVGANAKMEAVSYSYFGFLSGTIPGTNILITSGGGSINNFGTYMSGSYICTYPDAAGAVTDTVSILLER